MEEEAAEGIQAGGTGWTHRRSPWDTTTSLHTEQPTVRPTRGGCHLQLGDCRNGIKIYRKNKIQAGAICTASSSQRHHVSGGIGCFPGKLIGSWVCGPGMQERVSAG